MAGAKEENIRVILTLDPQWPDGIKKEFQSNLGNGNQLTFKNNNHPGFIVNFNIEDPQNTGYLFPDDKKKAMWVKKIAPGSNDCVTHPEYWDGFKAIDVKNNNKTLSVSNPNDGLQRFTFTLRFTKDPAHGPYIDWDPIGDDQNGGFESSLGALNTALIIGGTVIVIGVATKIAGLW